MAADPRWLDRAAWRDTQAALGRAGVYPGAIDGVPGEGTRRGVEALLERRSRQDTVPPPPRAVRHPWGRPIEWVVIHGTDSTGRTMEDIRRYHMESKGWSDIGYHEVIEESGEAVMGRPASKPGAHARDFNHHSYAIALVGRGDVRQYNAEQMATLTKRCQEIMDALGLEPSRFIGHREVNLHNGEHDHDTSKTCPGKLFDCDAFRATLA